MPDHRAVSLDGIDGVLVDGLDFCRQAYELFTRIQRLPDGVERIRLRKTKTEKRLVEELLPLARLLQARYREGRRIRVRWLSGSQPFDAILWSAGVLVDEGVVKRRQLVEITSAGLQDRFLSREQLHLTGGSWGAKHIRRNKTTGTIESRPHVYTSDERSSDLAQQIIVRLQDKGGKNYPRGTVLVVNCESEGLLLQDEWDDAIDRVRVARAHNRFAEVFCVEVGRGFSSTLYGHKR